ncbi:MAG: HPr family phosphocarrier protein [Desulfovibrionaceae bacterium]|nr:HPr family phosphocarrier protein [Desulfovibrionaceae bacterium]MDD4951981.1 HPr family phosphocarrier protein [Desulfovibrionaceae bacterium]
MNRQDNEKAVAGSGAGDVLSRQVVVSNQLGLHARPAGVLAQEAQNFASKIQLVSQEQEVDAKSILDILTLAAARGSAIEIRARGEDAERALDRLERLFLTRFGEKK